MKTTTPTSFNTGEHIATIVPNVFETMLALPISVVNPGPLHAARVSGTLGIAGEQVTGTVYVHLPESLARDIARSLLQSTPGQAASDNDVHDMVGELANMIGGGLKSKLCDADIFCAMSTPSVIRGAFAVEAPPCVRAETFYFACLGQRFAVEVHLLLMDASLNSI
jgi:CheY-specific phosphatase CheX